MIALLAVLNHARLARGLVVLDDEVDVEEGLLLGRESVPGVDVDHVGAERLVVAQDVVGHLAGGEGVVGACGESPRVGYERSRKDDRERTRKRPAGARPNLTHVA